MGKIILINIIRFVALVLLQVAVFKNIGYYNLVTVFPYILIILLAPISTSNLFLFVSSFLIGLSIDAFYDSMGVHAGACVALALFRILFHRVTLEVDEQGSTMTPSWGNMGFKWFSAYVLTATFIHHIVFFFLESFSFSNLLQILTSIVLSSIASAFVIFIISLVTYKAKSRVIN